MMRTNVVGIERVNKNREKTSIWRGCFIFKSEIVIIFRKAIGTYISELIFLKCLHAKKSLNLCSCNDKATARGTHQNVISYCHGSFKKVTMYLWYTSQANTISRI